MKKQAEYFILYLLFIIGMTLCLSSCDFFESVLTEEKEYENEIRDEVYSFEIDELEETLKVGGNYEFIAIPSTLQTDPVDKRQSETEWKSDMFANAVDNFFTYLYDESIDKWELHEIVFYEHCKDENFEAYEARFQLYRGINNDGQATKNIRDIVIDLREQKVLIFEANYSPESSTTPTFNYSLMKYSYEEILLKADKEIGWVFRKKTGNKCNISSEYDAYLKQWRINYTENKSNNDNKLTIIVDGDTSKILSSE